MSRKELLERGYTARIDGEPVLTKEQETALMTGVPDWEIVSEVAVDKLVRDYRFRNFSTALEYTNRVGALAEEVDHHPIITLQWGRVKVVWWTHEIGGLHHNDFVMAARSDLVYDEMRA